MAIPISSLHVHGLLSGASVDVMVRPTAPGGPRRFLPLRLALPADVGFAFVPMVLLRSKRGSYEEIHCLHAASGSIRYSAPIDDDDALGVLAAFDVVLEGLSCPPLSDRHLGRRIAEPALRHPCDLEARLDVFEGMLLRVVDERVPGFDRDVAIGIDGASGDPALFVPTGSEERVLDLVAAEVARIAGGGGDSQRLALGRLVSAVGSRRGKLLAHLQACQTGVGSRRSQFSGLTVPSTNLQTGREDRSVVPFM